MKLVFTLFFVGLLNVTINAQEFKFEKELINYGKIAQGSDGTRVFEFTNVGEEPITITRVSSSCGCTIPKKPEQPIMPGEKGKIEVSYDTKRLGGFSKTITIFSNAKTERKKIKIKGYISKEILPEKEKSMLSDS
ncbi:hypothetical protein LPB136_05155 [Tenacibaculum todarodis]|uniref:DUF1573 domain-containing protein n=1 Tax=Tenacibaculum todarodis TaxID=1850252 RepID=A0A1L3JI17_9FLAO|nr:DUF1573 domain-containing protein [Tenacibaculum todarodis]APG64786.1 hypothetical protein LPB136_05155 [Tenacibaculum todarodis]